jgi:hypothetical protein
LRHAELIYLLKNLKISALADHLRATPLIHGRRQETTSAGVSALSAFCKENKLAVNLIQTA